MEVYILGTKRSTIKISLDIRIITCDPLSSANHNDRIMLIDQIIKILDEFVPFSEDDLINDNEKFLYELMDEWEKAENKEKAIPSIFRLIEKYPHARLGSPGPLVHALETTKDYEGELHISLIRKPTPLTLWMYNRLINVEKNPKIIKGHLDRLKLFEKHPLTDVRTKKEAENFISHQQKRLQSLH
jgi:hypothetical protein